MNRSPRRTALRAQPAARLLTPLAALLVACGAAGPAFGQGDDRADTAERLLDGLRRRRLFVLVDEYCRDALRRPDLDPLLRNQLTIQWQRSRFEQAADAPPAARRELLQSARRLTADYLRDQSEHPRAILVRVQEALGLLALGEAVSRDADTALDAAPPGDAPPPETTQDADDTDRSKAAPATGAERVEPAFVEGRALLREGLRAVDRLDRELALLVPERFRRPVPPPAPAAAELTALQNQLRLHAVRARRHLALAYTPGSPDRVAALVEALQSADKTLAALPDDDPIGDRFRLERAILLRRTGRIEEAEAALAPDAWSGAPDALRLAALAERLRLALDAGRPEQAWELLESAGEPATPSEEFDLARLETCLAVWSAAAAAGDSDKAANREARALEMLAQIDRRHGPAWKRRADGLLLKVAATGRGPQSLAALRRTGDSLYRQGRLEEALRAYDRAAREASTDAQAERFDLERRAAAVEQQLGRHLAAAERLEAAALAQPEQAQAAAVHLSAAWNLAQALRQAPPESTVALQRRYLELLDRQRRTWPDDVASDSARCWAGRWYEGRRQWAEATEAYRTVPAGSPRRAEAEAGAGRVWPLWIAALRTDPAARLAQRTAALDYFEQAASAGAVQVGRPWLDSQRTAALIAARLGLLDDSAQAARVERLLRAALEAPDADDKTEAKAPPAPPPAAESDSPPPGSKRDPSADSPPPVSLPPLDRPAWRAAATALRFIAVAMQESRRTEAEQLAELVVRLPAAAQEEAVDRLAGLRAAAGGESAEWLARLELRLHDALDKSLDPAALDPTVRSRREAARAAALTAAGRRAEAVALSRRIAQTRPQDGAAQENLATLLGDSDEAAQWREALDLWRRIAAKSPPRSPRWYRAKYGVARSLFQTGDRAGAAQLIRFLQTTPPGLADSPLEPQFQELLRRCEAPR